MEEKNITGYPHIAMPWLKFYNKEFLKKELPKMSIYDYLKYNNKGNEELTAISYFGNKIPYYKLYENIDNSSRILVSLDVRNNDRIMCLMPNIPETAYLLYGGSQIGAVSDYVDPRPDSIDMNISSKKILELFKEEKAKHIISLDQCYLAMLSPIEKELKELGLERIILVSPSDSMNLKSNMNYLSEIAKFDGIKQLNQKIKYMKMIQEKLNYIRKKSILELLDYKDLVKDCKNVKFSPIDYLPNKIDVIVHTSGTSSPRPKPIPLTNDNMNSYVHQTFGGNMTMAPGDIGLHMLPYFAAFGIVNVAHSGLCHGNNLIQIPEFSPANMGKLIIKYKPQTIVGAPTWFLNLVNDPILKDKDLSFIKMITYGGDKMEIEDEEKINKFLIDHNCNIKITKGHGMSELSGCASYAINEYNKPSSMGIPLPNTIYGVVDPATKELLKFDDKKEVIEGELIVSSPAATVGVLDGKIIVPHVQYDGIDFIYTRDIAQMDKNGILTFLARSDRSFTRYDGFKVKPYELEKLLIKDEKIKYCVVSPYFDEKKFGNMIKIIIVLEDNIVMDDDEKLVFVNNLIKKYFINNSDVSTRQIPTKIEFKDKLPVTLNSKIDYNSIINEGLTGNEFTIELEETNISVGNVDIYPPEKNKINKKTKRV